MKGVVGEGMAGGRENRRIDDRTRETGGGKLNTRVLLMIDRKERVGKRWQGQRVGQGKLNTRVLLRSDRKGRVGEEMLGPGGRVGGS